MGKELKIIPAIFYKNAAGSEPVREWLKTLERNDRTIIGKDIKTVEFGWPIGMPTCRSIEGFKGLWEVRSKITQQRIVRILFFITGHKMILLHGFIKKTQKTPTADLNIAIKRKKEYENYGKSST